MPHAKYTASWMGSSACSKPTCSRNNMRSYRTSIGARTNDIGKRVISLALFRVHAIPEWGERERECSPSSCRAYHSLLKGAWNAPIQRQSTHFGWNANFRFVIISPSSRGFSFRDCKNQISYFDEPDIGTYTGYWFDIARCTQEVISPCADICIYKINNAQHMHVRWRESVRGLCGENRRKGKTEGGKEREDWLHCRYYRTKKSAWCEISRSWQRENDWNDINHSCYDGVTSEWHVEIKWVFLVGKFALQFSQIMGDEITD